MGKMLLLFLFLTGVCNAEIFSRALNRNKVSSFESLIPASTQNGHNFCTEASVTMYYDNSFGGLCTASSNLILFEQNNASYLKVSDVGGTMNLGGYFAPLVEIEYSTSTDIIDSTYNLSVPYEFLLDKEDPYVKIEGTYVLYSVGYGGSVALIYADGGTLSNLDGSYFDETNPCTTIHYKYQRESFVLEEYNQTVCCKKFSPAPSISPNIPKCKKFRSRSILYNNDFSIHATSAMNFTLINDHLITDGEFDNTSDIVRVSYEINNGFILLCFSDDPQGLNRNVSLPTGDFKMIFSMYFVPLDVVGIHLPKIGKLILQNGQTFMEEGVPFSPDNNCWYNQHNLNGQKVATNEFCCKEFE